MSVIAIGIGLYFLLSAVVVVSVCMISSRFSQQEELVEDWSTQDWATRRKPAPAEQRVGKATRYA